MRWMFLLWLTAMPGMADTVIAARSLRPFTVLAPEDLLLKRGEVAGTYDDMNHVIGLETRVAVYAGRPFRQGEIGPAALIDRNQIVALRYQSNGILIEAEGRALSRAAEGDLVRAMNLASRHTVQGRVTRDGSILVAR